jgi:hypothetical protein
MNEILLVKVKHSHYRLMGPGGFWEVKASRLRVRLSALCTGRLYPQEYPGRVDPEHMELSDATEKNPSDTIVDRSQDLSTSSVVS